MATGYEPLNRLKPVAEGIWLADGPAIRFYGIPFPTRMVAVRLASGAMWLHSPTHLTDALAAEVAALGPVRHLIAPNWIHYAYVGEWQARFPGASAWAAPGVRERAASRGASAVFDRDLGQDAPPEWAGEIAQLIVEGNPRHREAVFFHRGSRTLILADLIENFEPGKLPWWLRWIARLGRVADPDGRMPRDMRAGFGGHEEVLRAAVERMIGWGPERVILAHGRWYDRDGVAELRRALRDVLN